MSTDNVTYAAAGGTTPEAGAPDAYAGSYDTTEGRIYTVRFSKRVGGVAPIAECTSGKHPFAIG